MNLELLTQPDAPWRHALFASAFTAVDALRKLEQSGEAIARVVRGSKATTKGTLLDEFGSALQLAPRWGESWDALRDCLTDPAWLDDRPLVILFTDGVRLLEASGTEQRRNLLGVLADVAKLRNEPGSKKTPRPFHVIWQAEPRDEAELERKWPGLTRLT
jgi:RNAse (barnase) inhibitor barstar